MNTLTSSAVNGRKLANGGSTVRFSMHAGREPVVVALIVSTLSLKNLDIALAECGFVAMSDGCSRQCTRRHIVLASGLSRITDDQ